MRADAHAAAQIAPVAYLCSAYPGISHTFVLREVVALRRLGAEIHTFTVRRAGAGDLLSELDREEAARTGHLLPTSPGRLARAVARLLAAPRGAAALGMAAREAWRMRRPGARGTLWQAFYLAEAVLLWDRCDRRGIRHVHAHFANVASDVALLTAALGSAQDPARPWSFSFTLHGAGDLWDVSARKLAEKVRAARFVACISDYARSQLMALTTPAEWDRLHVVHCGVDPATYGAADAAGPPARDGPHLLTIGRLVPAKGQVQVVDAVHALRARGLPVTAEIIGEGPSRPDIEARIAQLDLHEVVTLAGAVGQDRVPARLRAATAFVLPSFAEGVPVVAMEAMALGTPVVSSRVAGLPELIEDGVSGLLVTPARSDELVEALARLLGDGELRARIAAAGREVVAARFDINAEAARLLQLFDGREGAGTLAPMLGPDRERDRA